MTADLAPAGTNKGQVEPVSLHIRGHVPLQGDVTVDGSKNAALALLAAAAAIPTCVELVAVPACADVDSMLSTLLRAGWDISRRDGLTQVQIDAPQLRGGQPDLAGAAAIRASYYLVAPLIAAYGRAALPWPGGCSVGDRSMDLHFAVYQAFGDQVDISEGGYTVRSLLSHHANGTVHIALPFRSRGATVAALLRALVAGRPVTVSNPNLSAELHSLYRALDAAGCELEIDTGQVSLSSARPGDRTCWRVPGDKIEAGTLACAIAATGGHGRINGVLVEDVAPLIEVLTLLAFQQ